MLRTTSNLKQVLGQIQSQKSLYPLAPSDTLQLEANPQPIPLPQKVSIIEEDKREYDSDTKITNENLRGIPFFMMIEYSNKFIFSYFFTSKARYSDRSSNRFQKTKRRSRKCI